MATKKRNERDYQFWVDLPDGGRRYWKERPGKIDGMQRFIKIVDKNETTTHIIQEVYNDDNVLIGRHQKYPIDTGHEDIIS